MAIVSKKENKIKSAKTALSNIEKLHNSQNKVTILFDRFSTIESEAKHKSILGKRPSGKLA